MTAAERSWKRGHLPIWLGIGVGWLAQLALKTLLPVVVLVGLSYWQHWMGGQSPWMQSPPRSSDPAWYGVQAAIFLGSIFAGILAARLVSRRSRLLPAALVVLSLLSTAFEQFSMPLSVTVLFIWAAGPCLGLIAGIWLVWRKRRSQRPL
jgi:hypothetical protein